VKYKYQLVHEYYPGFKAHFVAFGCKCRGFCQSCRTRLMAKMAQNSMVN